MAETRADILTKANALAERLRELHADFAHEPPEVRREHVQFEVDRAASGLNDADRASFMRALTESFPGWDGSGPAAAAPVSTPSEAPADPMALVARLIEVAGTMNAEQKRAAVERLRRAGFVDGGGAGAGSVNAPPASGAGLDGPGRILQQVLGHGPKDTLDSARAMELATALVEFAASLDQVVWNTWKVVAPTSGIKRTNPVRVTMAKFASGDATTGRAEVKQDLEKLRQLTAALTASVSQAGRSFANRHVEKFAPGEIETSARMSTGVLVSNEVKCWRKYVELAGPVDAQAIERDLLAAIATYAETLMKGASGRG